MPQAPPQSAANAAAATAQGAAPAAIIAAALPANQVQPPLPATGAANAGGANANGGGGQNGQTVPLPPGADDVQARIIAGASNFVSQPNSLLAGLWHHGGEAGAIQAAPSPQDQSNTSVPADTGVQAQAVPAKTVAALAPALAASSGAAPAGGSVAAADPNAGQAASAVAAPNPAAGTSASFAAPVTTDIQAAAAAPSANPAIPMPAHLLPAYEQVAINLKQAAQTGTDRIEIQLKPANLGAISVKLDVTHDGRITAVISADRSDTLHMLRQEFGGPRAGLARCRTARR